MKNERLGSLPAGLEWLAKKKEVTTITPSEEVIAKEVIYTAQAVDNEPETKDVFEDVQKQYNEHIAKSEELYLQTVQAKIKAGKFNKDSTVIKRKPIRSAAHIGLPDGWTRATIIVKESHINKLKTLSHEHQVSLKDLINIALSKFLQEI